MTASSLVPDLRASAQAVLNRWNSPKWEWHQQGPTADLMSDLAKALDAGSPAAVPGLLADLAKWMHAAYDRPPQTPQVRDILARLDAAVASSSVPPPQPLKTALDALTMMRGMSDGYGNELIDKAIAGLESHIADAGCVPATIEAIEQGADGAQQDPGSDSACLKRVVEVSSFAERGGADEDIIDYVARLARTAPVAVQTSLAESCAELLADGGEAIAVEAFLHAVNGGHRHDLYKLPLRSRLRAAITNGPGMREFLAEAGRKGWMSDTGSEPRINLVMFAWRAALGAALSGRESPQTAVATEIWRLRFNTGIEGADEPKWMYVDGAAGKHFVSEVEGRPGWEIQTLAPTP